MPRVLLVEDDEALARGLQLYLEREGFDVVRGRRGDTAVDLIMRTLPDLVTLDLMLPGLSGLEVCRELRRRAIDVPVIMLTAKGEEMDRVLGLEIGADDYLVKPFSLKELLARIHARLRRDRKSAGNSFSRYRFGECEVDLEHFRVLRVGRHVELTAKEFGILRLLIRAGGEVVSRNRILDEVWGEEAMDARRIDAHVVNLRRKLEIDATKPLHILSVYGEGYRFAG
jgi:DNA-binding response OmpR family regulator